MVQAGAEVGDAGSGQDERGVRSEESEGRARIVALVFPVPVGRVTVLLSHSQHSERRWIGQCTVIETGGRSAELHSARERPRRHCGAAVALDRARRAPNRVLIATLSTLSSLTADALHSTAQ